MKKITLWCLFYFSALALQARTVDVTAEYTGGSHLDKAFVSATMALTLNTLSGVEVSAVNPRGIKEPIYSIAIPVAVELDMVRLALRPFYYFKHTSDNPSFQDASAFGLNARMRMTLIDDRVENNYLYALVGASFARQKGTALYQSGVAEDRYYSQAAYLLALSQTFYDTFGFELDGSVFQYPDGVSKVAGFNGVLDQQDLAQLQTLDFVQALPKYSLGTRITRLWPDNDSTFYISYRYGELHTARPEHSFMLGNSFRASRRVAVDMVYNHVRNIDNKNRRDIGALRLSISF